MTTNESVDATTTTRARRQAVVTAVVGIASMSLGTLIVSMLSGGSSWSSFSALIPQLDTLTWAALVAIALPYLGGRSVRLALLAIALALVVAALAVLLQFGVHAGDPVFVAFAGWKALTLGCAAALGSVAGLVGTRRMASNEPSVALAPQHDLAADIPADIAQPGRWRRDDVLAATLLLSLGAGAVLMFALVGQWFDVYFTIWIAADPPTPQEITRYEWTAGLALVASGIAVALAIVHRRKGYIVASVVALILGLGIAFVFQVPSGRFTPKPAHLVNEDFPVCYGTTGDCPGG